MTPAVGVGAGGTPAVGVMHGQGPSAGVSPQTGLSKQGPHGGARQPARIVGQGMHWTLQYGVPVGAHIGVAGAVGVGVSAMVALAISTMLVSPRAAVRRASDRAHDDWAMDIASSPLARGAGTVNDNSS